MKTILILADTLRRDHVGTYGATCVYTPNLDRLAQCSTVFENSYISSYPCMPARQDLWTGKLSFLKRGWAPLEYDEPDLITTLANAGVETAMMTDHYHYWQYGSGNYHQSFGCAEFVRGQENDNYKSPPKGCCDYPADPQKLNDKWPRYAANTAAIKSEDDYFTAQIFNKGIQYVEQNQASDFFLLIDSFDPHEPFDPPIRFARPYLPEVTNELIKWPKYGLADSYTEEDKQIIHGLYCGEIAFLDECFGKLLCKLEELNLLEETNIIFTSDHGWLFGEHNWIGKHSQTLFNDIARTPLLIHSPALGIGRNPSLVQMCDIMPTVLDLMEVQKPAGIQGVSLLSTDQSISQRESIIFGVYGGEIYCTDGEFIFVKSPNDTNYPLYWYTKSHFYCWDFGQKNYFPQTVKRVAEFDGQRFPVQYLDAHPRHAAPEYCENLSLKGHHKVDALYNIVKDPGQQDNLIDKQPEQAARLRKSMETIMEQHHAPIEQFIRLGLTCPSLDVKSVQ